MGIAQSARRQIGYGETVFIAINSYLWIIGRFWGALDDTTKRWPRHCHLRAAKD